MFIRLTEGFMKDPPLEMDISAPTEDLELFGKRYRMYADDWKKHVHLKCTNRCDANCAFCIERPSRRDREDADAFLASMREVVDQMKVQGMFRTLSVTGGEPTIFPRLQDVVDFANEVKPTLFSVNSNGARMTTAFRPGSFHGWLNLSKHDVDDRHVFCRNQLVTYRNIEEFRAYHPGAKVRVQCVLGAGGVKTLEDIGRFMEHYRGFVDDFSFRSLIVNDANGDMSPLFRDFRESIFGHMAEQTIQDYYVYETYDIDGMQVTISWANMYLLQRYNEAHADRNFLEEIIVHPDGMVTGSWNKKTIVIKGVRGDARREEVG